MGVITKKSGKFPHSSGLSANLIIIYLAMPALILCKFTPLIKTLDLHGLWWVPLSMPWLNFLIIWLIISFIGKKLKWTHAKTGALILTAGLGNTSFVGFPILEALLTKSAIPIGILADQPGSFLIVSTLGLFVASKFQGTEATKKEMLIKIFSFPPFLAMLFSFLWALVGMQGFTFLSEGLEKISYAMVPLALFGVGFQTDFHWKIIRKRWHPLLIGLSLKLLIIPILFFVFYKRILGLDNFYVHVTVLEAAMATQITSAIVAQEFNLDTELANLMVGLSIPISIMSVPILNYVLF